MKRQLSDRTSLSSPIASAVAATLEPLEQRMLLYGATVTVNTGTTFQTMDGFGATMENWTNPPEYSDPAFYDKIANDLGASIARTAIWPTFESGNDDSDPNHFNWAQFDSGAIAQGMTFLKRLEDRGVKTLLGTVWTPPAWIKTNQSHFYGGTVRPDLRDEFAENLAAVVIAAKRDFGVDLTNVSLQNEPFFVQSFESATYTDVQMREIVRSVMHKFSAEGLSTQLTIPEEMAKSDRYAWYVNAIMNDPETKNFPGVFAVHSATNPDWPGIGADVAGTGHKIWDTENHGEPQTIQGALAMAQDMWNALTQANASAYLYWQWSGNASDAQHELMIDGKPQIKYYVAKHFYRYVRPGAVRIGASSSDARLRSISFKQPDNGAVTHILFNANDTQGDVTINLSGSGIPTHYKVYRTSGTENHVQLADITDTNAQVKITLPPQSIVTLYSGPDLVPVTATSGGSLPSKQGFADGATTNSLRSAAAKGDLATVQSLLNGGADPNAAAFGGYTPLHAAAQSPYDGATDVINALIAKGANPNLKTTEGFTPLHMAAMSVWTRGSSQTGPLAMDKLNALINGGASVSALDNAGRTALHWAAMMTKLTSITAMTEDRGPVKTLLDRGSAINAKDNKGFTPLDYAQREGNDAGATELKNRGGVNGAGGNDTTAPTADVIDVTPDPRTTAVDSVDVSFSEPVTGVDIGDFILMRDGNTQALTGATVAQVNSTTWRVSNLASLTAAAGAYMLKLEKTNSGIIDGANNALSTSASDSWTVTTGGGGGGGGTQAPFKGTPFAVGATPVTIQAEDYDLGGEGVAFHDTTPTTNSGGAYRTGGADDGVDLKLITNTTNQYRIGDAFAGEWVEYSLDVQQAADYKLDLRLSQKDPNAKMHVEVDGVNVTGSITVPDTNDFSVFTTVSKTINLSAGPHVLRLAFDAVAVNNTSAGVDWVKLTQVAPPAVPVTVASNTVSYVRDGASASTNFGNDPQMLVKKSSTLGNSREGYMLFDLSSIATITSAKLRLNGQLSDTTAASVGINVYSASNTTWTETGLTWNTKPAAGTTVRGSLTVTGTTAKWYEVDLTSFLKSEFAAGRKVVTLVLKAPNTSNPWAIFGSDDSANGPQIVVTP